MCMLFYNFLNLNEMGEAYRKKKAFSFFFKDDAAALKSTTEERIRRNV